MTAVDNFLKFIHAREDVRLNKAAELPRPWTSDPILHKYRFCNVDRNRDPVTAFIHDRFYNSPATKNQNTLWFMLCVSRLFNNPDTIKEIQFPHAMNWIDDTNRILQLRKLIGYRVFNPAYIVSTNGRAMDKIDYILGVVLPPMLQDALASRAPKDYSCLVWYNFLTRYNGFGDFMANQVITDMRYSRYLPRSKTPDWTTFVRPGPGTQRGLNRVFRGDVKAKASGPVMLLELRALQETCLSEFQKHRSLSTTFLDPNNVSNCLCEFDKYERARLGEGEPKQIYKPAKEEA